METSFPALRRGSSSKRGRASGIGRRGRALLVLSVAVGTSVFAQDDRSVRPPVEDSRAREADIFTVYWENDYFGGTDRHYTNGLKLSWLSSDYTSWGQRGGTSGKVGANLPVLNAPGKQKNFGMALGQNMYTPQRKDLSVPDPTDRPYAGWTYLEFSFLSKSETVMDTLSFQVGVVGPYAYGEEVQNWIHTVIGVDRARGWDYQLKDEAGVNVVYERKLRLYARSVGETLGLDFVPHVGVSLGNVQTYANAGATLRLGYNLPSDFGVQLIRPGGGGSTPIDDLDPRVSAKHRTSVFVFASADGRAVARDIFLDGNTWKDSPSVNKEPLVADLSYGAGVVLGRWQLTFSKVWRSREFEKQVENHNDFGSLTISAAF